MEETGAGFRKELVSKLLHLHFKEDKTKVSGDALQLTAELLKIFVVAAIRSVRQAQAEELGCVDVDQLEKVLPQLGCPPSLAACPSHQQVPCPRVLHGFWLQTGRELLILQVLQLRRLARSQQAHRPSPLSSLPAADSLDTADGGSLTGWGPEWGTWAGALPLRLLGQLRSTWSLGSRCQEERDRCPSS
ncbi:centromere protein X isoform X2 [Vicugna pacos]|uniref:Centromere protein X n=1 Tax=Vicugna pacos TaxID=30538 RepID=A0ABM5BII0_VICPA